MVHSAPDRLGNVLQKVIHKQSLPVITSNPDSTWGAGDCPIPMRLLMDTGSYPHSKLVYAILARFLIISHGTSPYPSHEYLAACTGVELRSIRRAIHNLRQRGWIQVRHRGKGHTCQYVLMDTVPPAALPNVQESERCLFSLIVHRQDIAAQTCYDRQDLAARTTEYVSTRGDSPTASCLVPPSLKTTGEIAAILANKRTRHVARSVALAAWKDLAAAAAAAPALSYLLTVVGIQRSEANRLLTRWGVHRVKQICRWVGVDTHNPAGFITSALREGWTFPNA